MTMQPTDSREEAVAAYRRDGAASEVVYSPVDARRLREGCRIDSRRYYVRELEEEREAIAERLERLRGLVDELGSEVFFDGTADSQRALRDAANLLSEARRKVSRAAELLPPAVQ